jgi:hypothetical protein
MVCMMQAQVGSHAVMRHLYRLHSSVMLFMLFELYSKCTMAG